MTRFLQIKHLLHLTIKIQKFRQTTQINWEDLAFITEEDPFPQVDPRPPPPPQK